MDWWAGLKRHKAERELECETGDLRDVEGLPKGFAQAIFLGRHGEACHSSRLGFDRLEGLLSVDVGSAGTDISTASECANDQ